MSYYQGDRAMRGDYYRGDPGLLAFAGKALRGVASAALTHVSGGLLKLPTFAATRPPTGAMRQAVSMIPGATGPGTLIQYDHSPVGGAMLPPGMGRPRALHWNRASYVTRGGGTSRWPAQLLFHAKGTEAVTSRRMNVGNARALRHALHRISGFARLARRVMHFTHPHAKGRMVFKFHRKKKAA